MTLHVFLMSALSILGITSNALAARCDPGAPPECYGRGPLGSTYTAEEATGYATTLTIYVDRTATILNPTWGHPGGFYVFSRTDDFLFSLIFFRTGDAQPSKTLDFRIEDEGRTLIQTENGVAVKTFLHN